MGLDIHKRNSLKLIPMLVSVVILNTDTRSSSKGLNMNANGCFLTSGGVYKPFEANSKSCNSTSVRLSLLPFRAAFSSIRNSYAPHQNLTSCFSKGTRFLSLSSASSPVICGEYRGFLDALPKLPRRSRFSLSPRASKDVPKSFRYPAMTKKPRWWWRTIACLPYFMPFHETWMYAETAYHLHHQLEAFEFLTYPFLQSLGRLPSWFLMAYFFIAYLGIVRRKEWPHFLRFHVVMGMLLEISLQVIGTISRWMPLSVYWGKIGMHFWTAVAFGYLFTVTQCIGCALTGMYADVPFLCDAAYIQIPYD
nr:protein TIC 20-I, chloroplastic-like [Ipomoea batatas]